MGFPNGSHVLAVGLREVAPVLVLPLPNLIPSNNDRSTNHSLERVTP